MKKSVPYPSSLQREQEMNGIRPRMNKMVTRKASSAVRSTTASGSVVYESDRAVNEYIQFHFGILTYM
jgi:hypothetical protein